MKNLLYEETQNKLGLCALENKRLKGDLITEFQYLKSGYKEDRGFLFMRGLMEKARGNRYKLHSEIFHLGIRKKFFIVKIH